MAKAQGGVRLSKAARDLNVGVGTIVEFLRQSGVDVEESPNTKIDGETYALLQKEYRGEAEKHQISSSQQSEAAVDATEEIPPKRPLEAEKSEESQRAASVVEDAPLPAPPKPSIKIIGKVDLEGKTPKPTKRVAPKASAVEKPIEVEATPKKEEVVESPEVPEVKPAIEIPEVEVAPKPELQGPKVVGKIELPEERRAKRSKSKPEPKRKGVEKSDAEESSQEVQKVAEKAAAVEKLSAAAVDDAEEVTRDLEEEDEVKPFRASVKKLQGVTMVGKIDLETLNERTRRKPEASATPGGGVQKRRRRKRVDADDAQQEVRRGSRQAEEAERSGRARKKSKGGKKVEVRPEISKEEIEEKIKETRARISSRRSSSLAKGVKYRREKRNIMEARRDEALERDEMASRILKVSEFVSVNELAGMMNIPVTQVIETCMNMGLMVSINMRLDAEQLTLVADEFNFSVEFVGPDLDKITETEKDEPEDLIPRPPVFTVLGHVDHGKTTLCDTIRKSNVTAGEAGGITQHLGAYSITLPSGRKMTLIDTPGHESFTAMRARGAKLTDVAIIVVSAEDGIMPQTIEAINHASVTGAKIVFAINKIDSPKANPEKVKEELANHNYLIEEWGGKYQSQDISAKKNQNIDLLLEKVLLEADIMELQANPNRRAEAAVIESMVDKGRGHCATVLIQNGTLRKGDSIVSGGFFGRVKALFDDAGKEVEAAGPSTPVLVVGLNGAPQAGDSFIAVESDKEARSIASKIGHIRRVQEMSARKHITLDEIGRRIAIGSFQELNIIVKGDVDGSVEALSDSLIQLSTEEIQVNVIHRGVGQITESDVTLAETSNAIIVGFQVRPSVSARRMAEQEQIDIRLYSVIYDAIEEIQSAMEGMLSPEVKEEVSGTAEVLETFRISKVGTVAGCIVREGKIMKGNKVHIVRDGIVIYTSELESLKRFKDEVREVTMGMECGMSVKGYNDIKVGDFIESFKETEVKRTL